MDAVQEVKRQQTTEWQRLNSITLVENSKQTIRQLENLEEHVQNLETQCENNSRKLTDINLLVYSLLELVNKFAVAVENLQDNRTLEKMNDLLDSANKRIIKIIIMFQLLLYKISKTFNEHDLHEADDADYVQFLTESQEDLHCLRHRADDSIRLAFNEKENQSNKDKSIQSIKNPCVAQNKPIIPQTNYRCTKNDFGFKMTISEIQYDNRVRFHSSSACFEGCEISSLNIEVPIENILVPNIEEQPFMHDARSKVTSSETWER
ncbi:unnamed protein product [Mytilus coruscus]|uniref:Uncharacterized protein n=1 Tax=Mytilus coruscus TaxID=42192 RepID=A0A6J8B2L1_MYTCO|nr:unnamed protein product [Mytilus coruscus]